MFWWAAGRRSQDTRLGRLGQLKRGMVPVGCKAASQDTRVWEWQCQMEKCPGGLQGSDARTQGFGNGSASWRNLLVGCRAAKPGNKVLRTAVLDGESGLVGCRAAKPGNDV